jgi:hypothetical protein
VCVCVEGRSTKAGGWVCSSQAGAFKLATAAAPPSVEKCGIMGDVKNTQIPNQMIRAGGGDHDNLHSEGPLTFQSSAQLTVVPFVPG